MACVICEMVGKGCGLIGQGCGKACELFAKCKICDAIKQCIFPANGVNYLFSLFIVAVSGAVLFYGVQGNALQSKYCSKATCSGDTWFLQALACGAVNIVFAIALHIRFTVLMRERREEAKHTKGADWSAVAKFLAHDIVVFLYLLFLCYVVYWVIKSSDDNLVAAADAARTATPPNDAADDGLEKAAKMLSSISTCWVVFLVLAPCVSCCSLKHEISREVGKGEGQGSGQGAEYGAISAA